MELLDELQQLEEILGRLITHTEVSEFFNEEPEELFTQCRNRINELVDLTVAFFLSKNLLEEKLGTLYIEQVGIVDIFDRNASDSMSALDFQRLYTECIYGISSVIYNLLYEEYLMPILSVQLTPDYMRENTDFPLALLNPHVPDDVVSGNAFKEFLQLKLAKFESLENKEMVSIVSEQLKIQENVNLSLEIVEYIPRLIVVPEKPKVFVSKEDVEKALEFAKKELEEQPLSTKATKRKASPPDKEPETKKQKKDDGHPEPTTSGTSSFDEMRRNRELRLLNEYQKAKRLTFPLQGNSALYSIICAILLQLDDRQGFLITLLKFTNLSPFATIGKYFLMSLVANNVQYHNVNVSVLNYICHFLREVIKLELQKVENIDYMRHLQHIRTFYNSFLAEYEGEQTVVHFNFLEEPELAQIFFKYITTPCVPLGLEEIQILAAVLRFRLRVLYFDRHQNVQLLDFSDENTQAIELTVCYEEMQNRFSVLFLR